MGNQKSRIFSSALERIFCAVESLRVLMISLTTAGGGVLGTSFSGGKLAYL